MTYTKEKRYIEIEVEFECDEGDMTPAAWGDFTYIASVIEDMQNVKSVSLPKIKSRKEMK